MEAVAPHRPFEESIEKLIAQLRRAELPENHFNQYRSDDPELDVRGGAAKRRENLRRYLKALREPRFAFIGLAAGYRGARFTGIAFTDEDRLCFPGSCYDRTSRRARPWREVSGGVVMGQLGARTDVVCWNLAPWHPHLPGKPLSNADPGAQAIGIGLSVLEFLFQRLYPKVQPVAVGRVSAQALGSLSINGKPLQVAAELRHPAHGGAAEFRAQAAELLGASAEEE